MDFTILAVVLLIGVGIPVRNKLIRKYREEKRKKDGRPGRYSSFICGNYSRSGRGACTIHTIYETVLNQLVLEEV